MQSEANSAEVGREREGENVCACVCLYVKKERIPRERW